MKIIVSLLLCYSCYILGAEDKTASIKRGAQTYTAICFACHGKNLEGGSGFNLKDAEWIHGSSPEQILQTLKKGFPEKGMIAFENVYDEKTLKDVVNFILSKQEGLRDLQYQIFHNISGSTNIDSLDWSTMKAQKNGTYKEALLNFNLPEVNSFAMRFLGKLHIAKNAKYYFRGSLKQNSHFQILIDGQLQKLKFNRNRFYFDAALTQGIHTFETRYIKKGKKSSIDLVMSQGKEEVALSSEANQRLKNSKHIVTATTSPLVIRKRIDGLPSKTIAVAFPEKVNYSVNPADGAINGLWFGDFLDIAPNIMGRGNRGSKIMGPVSFKGDKGLRLLLNGKPAPVKFHKYTTYQAPQFHFKLGNCNVTYIARPQKESLVVTYTLSSLGSEKVSLEVPAGCKISSKHGVLKGQQFEIDDKFRTQFTLTLSK